MQKNGEKMKKLKSIMPGTAVCAVIAAAATLTGGISIGGFSFELIGAPVIAILLGMILTLVFPKLASLTSLSGGIKFTSKKILQWAVVILGFSLNLSTIAQVGAKSLPVIVGTISISLIVAFIMMKLMKVDPKTACLIGVGSSICGGIDSGGHLRIQRYTFSRRNGKADKNACHYPDNARACTLPHSKSQKKRRQ